MSGFVGSDILKGAEFIAGMPQRQAQTAKTWAEVPLTQAQTGLTGAEADYYRTGLTPKTQMEAEQIRIQNRLRQMGLDTLQGGGGGGGGNYTMPIDPARAGAGATTGTSYSAPASTPPADQPPAVTTAPAARPALPPPAPDTDAAATGTAMRAPPPGSVQLAQADGGTVSDVGQQLYSPGYRPVVQPTATGSAALVAQAAPPAAPPAPAMTTPVPTTPGARQLAQATPPATPPGAVPGAQQPGFDASAISPNGRMLPGVGPVSKEMYFGYVSALANGQSTVEASRALQAQRYQRLAELAGGAMSPADWERRVKQAWSEGLIDAGTGNEYLAHYDNRFKIVSALTTAAEQVQAGLNLYGQGLEFGPRGVQPSPTAAAGAETKERGGTAGRGDTVEMPYPDASSPTGYSKDTVPRALLPWWMYQHGIGPKPQGEPPAAVGVPGTSTTGPRSEAAPSGFTPNVAFNMLVSNEATPGGQTSTAGARGKAQIMPGTFDEYKIPNSGENFNNEDDRMTVARRASEDLYRRTNGDPARIAVGYFSGKGNIAPPGSATPWKEDAPDTNGVRTSDYVRRYLAKLPQGMRYAGPGVPPPQPGGGGGDAGAIAAGMIGAGARPENLSVGPVQPPTAALAPPAAATPPAQPQTAEMRYGVPGVPVLTPQQQKDLEVDTERRKQAVAAAAEEQKKQYGALGDQFVRINTAGEIADATRARLYDLQHAADMFTTGTTAAAREAGWKAASTALRLLGIDPPEFMSSAVTGAEVINKEGNQLAQALTNKLGSNEAARVFDSILAANPNLSLSKGGFKAVVDSYVQGVQRDRDLYNYMQTWLTDPKHNNSLMGMLPAFQREHPVETYASRVLPFPAPMANGKLDTSKMIPDVIYKNSDGSKTGRWTGTAFELQ